MSKIRQDWIQASRFHELSDEEVLNRVLEASRLRPDDFVVLDLDSTLYEVGPRTFQILKEWAATPEAAQFAYVRRALDQLEHSQVGYSLKDTLSAVGLNLASAESKAAFSLAKPFWSDRFFSNDYLKYDRPYEGASRFVQALQNVGARIVYLTGRDEPGMGRATREILERDGFPVRSERVQYFLKPGREGDDHIHKVNAIRRISEMGGVVASFENEPKNLVAMHEISPAAIHVFVETVCSDHPAEPKEGLYKVSGFQDFKAT